ncbi:MAG TPA: SpoIIE family protein phosphatase [Solirubrobacteraceae bacterium]|nr:SpoIIE family protein phosphatase [Solirubrobacteraceae bacterium]
MGDLEALLRRSGPGFGEILDVLGEAVTIRDRGDRIIYANRAALNQMGFSSLDDLQARPPGSIMGEYLVSDELGRQLTMDDIPSVRLLRGQPADPLLIRTVHRASGELHWNVLKASGLHDDDGEIIATVMITEDLTAVKNAELRSRFLDEASRQLASSLDYAQTLRNVGWAVVPQIADWCGVDLVDERGRRERVVAAHRDPDKLVLAERLREFEPERLDPEQGIGRVVRTGEPELYPEITDEMLVPTAVSEEHLRLLRELGMRSVLIVAIRTPARILGTMTLVSAESGRRFSDDDVRFAEQLADRAAVAVENARLYRAQTLTAVTLQRSLLPETVPQIGGWQVSVLYRPAGSEPQVEVGGDFYDFVPADEGWLVVIGDVTGKGVQAASLTSLMRHGARFVAQTDSRPAAILQRLDSALKQRSEMAPCTALCLRLGDDVLTLCSAGHPMPLCVSATGEIRELGTPQLLLGIRTAYAWRDERLALDRDATIVLHTDGVTDVRGAHGRFGEQRLHAVLRRHAGSSPDELLAHLDEALAAFQVGPQPDDTAMIALRRQPAAKPTGARALPARAAGASARARTERR